MRKYLRLAILLSLIFVISCKKSEKSLTDSSRTNQSLTTLSSGCSAYPIIDNMPTINTDADSTEVATVLGNQRTNPYTLANMRKAYNNLGFTSVSVNVTNLYVRFLPSSVDQLSILDSTLDEQGIELFDAPMDYDVIQEGDYYQDPSIPDSSITWQYAVVPSSYQAPQGMTYQILAQIHIPADNYTAVETEAERLASIQDSINCSGGGIGVEKTKADATGKDNSQSPTSQKKGQPYTVPQTCDNGYHWDSNLQQCVADGNCPAGYYWETVTQTCIPLQSNPSAPDAQTPAGNITVSDINFGNTPNLRSVRVVAKRWFKVERTYTDNNGNFQFTKHFKHKVKIRVKFKNDYSTIKVFRLTKFWQMLYPVARTIGVFSSDKNNIHYNFYKYNTSVADRGNLYWAAATAINAVQEFRDFASQENFGQPPLHLKIFLTRYAYGSGMTPMWNKRWYSGLPFEVVSTFFVSQIYLPAGAVAAFTYVLKHEVDMAISYKAPYNDDYSSFYSDQLKTTIYHELAHSTHYVKLSENWYATFVGAEINETVVNFFSPSKTPYGDGSNQNDSPIIALGESWAYHIGQYLADKKYGASSVCSGEQGTCYSNGYITGLNSHQIALENFDPTFTSDPFHWIPKGLYYDLMDTRNDIQAIPRYINLDDQVSGYTNQEFFSAFSSSIQTLQSYKQNLLQQNNNIQSAQVLNLFQQYDY